MGFSFLTRSDLDAVPDPPAWIPIAYVVLGGLAAFLNCCAVYVFYRGRAKLQSRFDKLIALLSLLDASNTVTQFIAFTASGLHLPNLPTGVFDLVAHTEFFTVQLTWSVLLVLAYSRYRAVNVARGKPALRSKTMAIAIVLAAAFYALEGFLIIVLDEYAPTALGASPGSSEETGIKGRLVFFLIAVTSATHVSFTFWYYKKLIDVIGETSKAVNKRGPATNAAARIAIITSVWMATCTLPIIVSGVYSTFAGDKLSWTFYRLLDAAWFSTKVNAIGNPIIYFYSARRYQSLLRSAFGPCFPCFFARSSREQRSSVAIECTSPTSPSAASRRSPRGSRGARSKGKESSGIVGVSTSRTSRSGIRDDVEAGNVSDSTGASRASSVALGDLPRSKEEEVVA